jgi:cell division protein FtsQ
VNTGQIIRKALFVAVWLTIGAGMLSLLIAAIGKQKRDQCRDYSIKIKGSQEHLFVDEKAIVRILEMGGKGKIRGQKRSSFNLLEIERTLESNVWIRDAEIYFDNHDVLHVSVKEREPLARVFTLTGKSFYIDDSGKMMPLSDRLSARVPVFTGFPAKIISKRDTALMDNVRTTARIILKNPFWMSQVSQIDISADRNFEMIPVVGNHTVLLGDGGDMEQKFHRLFVFYKNVMSKTGFDKYKAVNVQYAGQVVGIKNNYSKADTVQLRRNVERLLRQAREMQNDSIIASRQLKEQRNIHVEPTIAATVKPANGTHTNEPNAESFTNPVLVTNPVPVKLFSDEKTSEKAKAVMPKRNNQ